MLRQTLFAILTIASTVARAQHIATFNVDLSRPTNGLSVPVAVDLDPITSLPDSALQLVRVITSDKIYPVDFQIEDRQIHWIIPATTQKNIRYELVQRSGSGAREPYIPADPIRAVSDNGELTILNGSQQLLRYVYKTVYPPAGIDTAYKKSGFIHPLWSPKGQVLTRIQAPDHYHHYGVWNPWTHILYKGDTVDCWNLRDRKGTVRFAKFVSVVSGPAYAQFEALHEHVAFHKDGSEEVMLNELQTVRVYRPADNTYLFDLTIRLNCATQNPVLLLAYRYGGVGWRATEEWNKDNSEVLTSEGKTRTDADGSKARWCIVQGAVGGDYAGAEMMSSPVNYNYPEPLRIWPLNMNGRGDVYANFSPTKDIDWPLYPGHCYVLHYRWAVFNGHFTKEKAESAWSYFSTPAKITITY